MMNINEIKFPSIVPKLPDSFYHSPDCPGLSKTDLDAISISYSHYLAKINGNKKETPALRDGKMVHSAILTPEVFKEEWVMMPEFSGKGSKKEKEEFIAANPGKNFMDVDDLLLITRIEESIKNHMTASSLLSDGIAECSAFSIDGETGLNKRCKMDYLRNDKIILDLKTISSATLKSFSSSVTEHGYDKQAAYYCDIMKDITGEDYDFIFIVVEKTAPFSVAVFTLDDDDYRIGRELYKRDLKKFIEYSNKNNKGFPDRIQVIKRSKWAYDINNR